MAEIVGPVDVKCSGCGEWVDSRDVYWRGIKPFCFDCHVDAEAEQIDGADDAGTMAP